MNASDELRYRAVREFADLLFLKQMLIEPVSGYDCQRLIRVKYSSGLSPGRAYSTLARLEKEGFACSSIEGKRHVYAITEKGKSYIQTFLESSVVKVFLLSLEVDVEPEGEEFGVCVVEPLTLQEFSNACLGMMPNTSAVDAEKLFRWLKENGYVDDGQEQEAELEARA